MKKPEPKVIDLAAKRYARLVLTEFDRQERQQKREQELTRAEVERKARGKL